MLPLPPQDPITAVNEFDMADGVMVYTTPHTLKRVIEIDARENKQGISARFRTVRWANVNLLNVDPRANFVYRQYSTTRTHVRHFMYLLASGYRFDAHTKKKRLMGLVWHDVGTDEESYLSFSDVQNFWRTPALRITN